MGTPGGENYISWSIYRTHALRAESGLGTNARV